MKALRKAWEAGLRDVSRVRRDPDLAFLHDEPDFEKMYPLPAMATLGLKPPAPGAAS